MNLRSLFSKNTPEIIDLGVFHETSNQNVRVKYHTLTGKFYFKKNTGAEWVRSLEEIKQMANTKPLYQKLVDRIDSIAYFRRLR